MSNKTTHFGFQTINQDEKEKKVGDVFHSVAKNYDVMNDVMSLGIHRLWKAFTIRASGVKSGDFVLDLAGGSGDLAMAFCQKVGPRGQVILSDINQAMLSVGRNRLLDAGIVKPVEFVQANAECLPFKKNHFNLVTMAFGLRNVTDKQKALNDIFHVIKPGGKIMILEFSKVAIKPLSPIYDWYSFKILPKLGKWIADDEASYQYLAESIRMHPDQETLNQMIGQAGFEDGYYHNLSGGIVALHIAYKY